MTGNEYPYERSQAAVFVAAVLGVGVASRLLQGGGCMMVLALGAVSIAVWHGAFDNVLAKESLEPTFGKHWDIGFYAAYVTLGAGCLMMWMVWPVWALVLFLSYSALHFGTERERVFTPWTMLTGFATGLVPICAACRWWPHQVQAIFGEMLRGQAPWGTRVADGAGMLLWPAFGLALLGILYARRDRALLPALLLAVQVALFRWCPPLPAFAVYFCLWHTPDHLIGTSLGDDGRFSLRVMMDHLRAGTGIWLLSLAAIGAACCFGRHTLDAYSSVLFIALSALTVPHMVLAEVCRRQQQHAAEARPGLRRAEGVVGG